MINERQLEARLKEAKSYILNRAGEVESTLSEFWVLKHLEWRAFPGIIHEAFDLYDELTNGGKKLRAVLTILGYEACRHLKSPNTEIEYGLQRVAAAVEILHNASLIHDDIIDRSELRRGKATIYRRYSNRYISLFSSNEEAIHYGIALALNLGDQGQSLAEQLLLSSGFPEGILLRAVSLLGVTTSETVVGQFLDIEHVSLDKITQDQILQIYEYKTARYTVQCPMMLGAILADAPESVLAGIREYAIPIGIAFQIQDDILGLFAEPKTTQKTGDEDLKEGKKTILFELAYKRACATDKQFLLSVHGNPQATHADFLRVKDIITYTGASHAAKEMASKLVEKAKAVIPLITCEPTSRDKLLLIAEYCIHRRD
ncbi:MAG: polyprenyl synthetase family protein [Saprospiraceae bacterium]|jgi:geranylgeranyl diphosphate synthase type I|nr:polyprenyl synthetase family protein [Saprospiraceae bacterium]